MLRIWPARQAESDWKPWMTAKGALGPGVGDDPRRVEAEQLLVGERGPSMKARLRCHIDEPSRDEHIVKARSCSPAVESVAMDADVEAASPVVGCDVAGHCVQPGHQVVGKLLAALRNVEHGCQLLDVGQQRFQAPHFAHVKNVQPRVFQALDLASVDEVVDEHDVRTKLDDRFDVACSFDSDLVGVRSRLLCPERVPADSQQSVGFDDLDQDLIRDRAGADDARVVADCDRLTRCILDGAWCVTRIVQGSPFRNEDRERTSREQCGEQKRAIDRVDPLHVTPRPKTPNRVRNRSARSRRASLRRLREWVLR